MKRCLTLLALTTIVGLAAPAAGSAHQVKPPGLDGQCATVLHAGKAVPAHTLAMPTAAANSPAVTSGFCVR